MSRLSETTSKTTMRNSFKWERNPFRDHLLMLLISWESCWLSSRVGFGWIRLPFSWMDLMNCKISWVKSMLIWSPIDSVQSPMCCYFTTHKDKTESNTGSKILIIFQERCCIIHTRIMRFGWSQQKKMINLSGMWEKRIRSGLLRSSISSQNHLSIRTFTCTESITSVTTCT